MSESFEPRSPANPASQQNNLTTLKVPPHSVEAEQAVLGGLMVDNTEWDNIADVLMAEDFYRAEHQLIYQVMMTQSEANSPIDVVTLAESLNSLHELNNAGGLDYLSELSGNARGTANIHAYAEIIRERAILRRLISVANNIADSGYNTGGKKAEEIVDEAEQKVFNISDERPQDSGPVFVNPILAKAVERIDELAGTEGDLTGLPSGYTDLDHMTSGWQKSDLVIVAGRPSMGKTAFAMNLVENVALASDRPIMVFSMEMPAEQLVIRMLSSLGRIDQSRVRTGKLEQDDWPKLASATEKLKDTQIFIDDTPALTPTELRSRVRRLVREQGDLGMIMIDYLQLMRVAGSNEGRTAEISEISRSLKALAKEFKVPVVALSQLNRALEQRPNKRPVNSDLRESGAIEQDADVIMFIYRDEVYNEDSPDQGVAEIIIGKQRNGPIGTCRLSFRGQFTRFENLARSDYENYGG